MKIFTERAFRERLFEEREKIEKEQRLDRNLMEIQHELYNLTCRIERLEYKTEQTEDYRKMLDKAEHKVYGNIEDEPQTDCAWR